MLLTLLWTSQYMATPLQALLLEPGACSGWSRYFGVRFLSTYRKP